MNQSLANYVSFPFPFAHKVHATKTEDVKDTKPSKKNKNKQHKKHQQCNSSVKKRILSGVSAALGSHYVASENGTFTPRSLVELSVRRVCGTLVSDLECEDWDGLASQRHTIPSEVASVVLKYLKLHDVLTSDHFRVLARHLFHEWDLSSHLDVDSSWFDDIATAPLQAIKRIDCTNCIHLESLGSHRWLQVDELPNLVAASFQDCIKLSKSVPDMLQSSSRLTTLNLSGCRKIDDRSLLGLRRLFRLKSLDLSGCHQVTDEGFKCLTGLSNMEKLVVSRCSQLTDHAFEDIEPAFPKLFHLDVAHCRITDVALTHFGHQSSLRTLILRGCRHIGDAGMERLATLTALQYFDARHCEEVRSLPAEWTELRTLLLTRTAFAETEAAVLAKMTKLTELDLRACRILKRGFELISKLVHLKRLTLAETALTNPSLLQICKNVPHLVALDVSHTEITDVGAEGVGQLVNLEVLHMDTSGITNRAVASVSGLKKLQRLDLFGTSVSDSGLFHLASLPDLRELEICSGAISNRGVEMISRLTTLRSLNLSQNRSIDGKGLRCLRALTKLTHLNLSNTSISAVSLRHLHGLTELESLSIFGCEVNSCEIEALQELLPKLRTLRCT